MIYIMRIIGVVKSLSTRKPFGQDVCCFVASWSHDQIIWQPSEKINTSKAFDLIEFFTLRLKYCI